MSVETLRLAREVQARRKSEIDDVELDALWNGYLDGIDLPPPLSAHMTIRGPEIILHYPPETHRWVRSREVERGRLWHKTLTLG
jgi:hypothetical protein